MAGVPLMPAMTNTPISYLAVDLFINKASVLNPTGASQVRDLIAGATLKPFQKLRSVNLLVVPKLLYAVSATAGLPASGDPSSSEFGRSVLW